MRKDGSRFWASVVMTALQDDAGACKGFAKITRDLTERRLAEEEARRRRRSGPPAARRSWTKRRCGGRAISWTDPAHIAEGVTVQAPDGKLIFANDAAAQLCGFESGGGDAGGGPAQHAGAASRCCREDGRRSRWAELPGRHRPAGHGLERDRRFQVEPHRRGTLVLRVGARRCSMRAGNVEPVGDRLPRVHRAPAGRAVLAVPGGGQLGAGILARLRGDAGGRWRSWPCRTSPTGAASTSSRADGTLEQLAVAHVDPGKRELAKEWRRRWPPRPRVAVVRVVGSGRPELLAEITDAMIEAGTPDPEQRRMAEGWALRSAMVVPRSSSASSPSAWSPSSPPSRHGATPRGPDPGHRDRPPRLAGHRERARLHRGANAVQTRDNFLAIASHELRTPLSALTVLMSLAGARGRPATACWRWGPRRSRSGWCGPSARRASSRGWSTGCWTSAGCRPAICSSSASGPT